MKNLAFAFILIALTAWTAFAQTGNSWIDWSKSDVDKMLNRSAWGQTQTDTDTSEMFFTPTNLGTATIAQTGMRASNDQRNVNNSRADRGATNQAVSVNYRVRLLSAKPIREAISRNVLLTREAPVEGLEDMMQLFVNRDFSQFIVVIVGVDSTDGRFSGPALQALGSSTTDTLKNMTYLERNDGKRLYLMDYRAPQPDGLGAKFSFPRIVDGKPFVTAESGTLRFFSEVGSGIKLNVKYKISDMMVDGKLEL